MRKIRRPLLWLVLCAAPASVSSALPGANCVDPSGPVAALICRDAEVAALDRRLTEVYQRAEQSWPTDELRTLHAEQQGWIGTRRACASVGDIRGCVVTLYRHRTIELQIRSGQLPAPIPVVFSCPAPSGKPFTASYYHETDPPSAMFSRGEDRVIAFLVRSGSGARYQGREFDFWEHRGEAAVDWHGRKMICQPRD